MHPCPCCGHTTFEPAPPGTYLVCPVCFWTDDLEQFRHPDRSGGTNEPSLREAQRNFEEFRASSRDFLSQAREPTRDEGRSPDWSTLDEVELRERTALHREASQLFVLDRPRDLDGPLFDHDEASDMRRYLARRGRGFLEPKDVDLGSPILPWLSLEAFAYYTPDFVRLAVLEHPEELLANIASSQLPRFGVEALRGDTSSFRLSVEQADFYVRLLEFAIGPGRRYLSDLGGLEQAERGARLWRECRDRLAARS